MEKKTPGPADAGEDTADAEFERVLRNLVNTPHKPHVKPLKKTETPQPRGD